MEFVVVLAIAGGLGYWAYSDAKSLQARGIRVGSMSPTAWGWCVALFAIVFGVLYLIQRSEALRALSPTVSQPGPPSFINTPPPSGFCTQCGRPLPSGARFCSACGAAAH